MLWAASRDVASFLLPWFPQNLAAEAVASVLGASGVQRARQSAASVADLLIDSRGNWKPTRLFEDGPIVVEDETLLTRLVAEVGLGSSHQALIDLLARREAELVSVLAETIGYSIVPVLVEREQWQWREVFLQVAARAQEDLGNVWEVDRLNRVIEAFRR